jgi:osmotically-inducible protein OsmY
MATVTLNPTQILRREVERRITEALHERAGHEAERITATITGSRVVLTGTVATTAERDLATLAAGSTPGVAVVEDHLIVEPDARPGVDGICG